MALFKKEAPKQTGTPTDKVLNLRQQGMSDNQIVQQMQRENHSSEDIFNALSQADLKAQNTPGNLPQPTTSEPEAPSFNMKNSNSSFNMKNSSPSPQQAAPIMQPPSGMQPPETIPPSPQDIPQQTYSNPQSTLDIDKIEEIAESIIDEKWDDLVKNVNKIIDWKAEMESKISELEDKNTHLQESFDKLHKGILDKIDDYDKTLLNVGAELKAMNEIFQKIMPTFTDNVQTLQRITQKLSKPKTLKK